MKPEEAKAIEMPVFLSYEYFIRNFSVKKSLQKGKKIIATCTEQLSNSEHARKRMCKIYIEGFSVAWKKAAQKDF